VFIFLGQFIVILVGGFLGYKIKNQNAGNFSMKYRRTDQIPYRGKLRRGKVTKFWTSDEYFPRRKFSLALMRLPTTSK